MAEPASANVLTMLMDMIIAGATSAGAAAAAMRHPPARQRRPHGHFHTNCPDSPLLRTPWRRLGCRSVDPESEIMHRSGGVTLLELLIALMIAAVLSTAAVSGLTVLSLNARRTADVNGFVTAVQLARSEALERGRPVVLCKTADDAACGGAELDFDRGWMVFADERPNNPPRRSPDEPLLFAYRPEMTGSIRANRRLFVFRPFGQRSTNGTVTFCDRRGATEARAVIVSVAGRPRVSRNGAGLTPLRCEP